MELNIKVEGETQQEIIANLMAYLLEIQKLAPGSDISEANVPGVTAQHGGGGGP